MSPSPSSAKTTSAPDSFFTAGLAEADPDIAAAISGELGRQRHDIGRRNDEGDGRRARDEAGDDEAEDNPQEPADHARTHSKTPRPSPQDYRARRAPLNEKPRGCLTNGPQALRPAISQ